MFPNEHKIFSVLSCCLTCLHYIQAILLSLIKWDVSNFNQSLYLQETSTAQQMCLHTGLVMISNTNHLTFLRPLFWSVFTLSWEQGTGSLREQNSGNTPFRSSPESVLSLWLWRVCGHSYSFEKLQNVIRGIHWGVLDVQPPMRVNVKKEVMQWLYSNEVLTFLNSSIQSSRALQKGWRISYSHRSIEVTVWGFL